MLLPRELPHLNQVLRNRIPDRLPDRRKGPPRLPLLKPPRTIVLSILPCLYLQQPRSSQHYNHSPISPSVIWFTSFNQTRQDQIVSALLATSNDESVPKRARGGCPGARSLFHALVSNSAQWLLGLPNRASAFPELNLLFQINAVCPNDWG